jgi:hypothetical protein
MVVAPRWAAAAAAAIAPIGAAAAAVTAATKAIGAAVVTAAETAPGAAAAAGAGGVHTAPGMKAYVGWQHLISRSRKLSSICCCISLSQPPAALC